MCLCPMLWWAGSQPQPLDVWGLFQARGDLPSFPVNYSGTTKGKSKGQIFNWHKLLWLYWLQQSFASLQRLEELPLSTGFFIETWYLMLAIWKQSVCTSGSLLTKMKYIGLIYILNMPVISLLFFKNKTEKINGKWKSILPCNSSTLYIITILLFHRESKCQ